MKPQLNRRKQDPLLDHARECIDHIYGTIAAIPYLVRQDKHFDLIDELHEVLAQFPNIHTLNPDMILPPDWEIFTL